jgi:hypothetical protein
MSQKMQIDVKREGLSIRLRFTKPVPGDDPELVRVNEHELPIVQALIVAAGIVSEAIPGVQTAFTIANYFVAQRAKEASEAVMRADAPPTSAEEAEPTL